MTLLCRLGWHHDEIAPGRCATKDEPALPMRRRCTRCGRETPGWDVGPASVVRYAGHLTAKEVRAIKRRGVTPAYITPQVERELAASAKLAHARAQARTQRGPADVVPIRRKA